MSGSDVVLLEVERRRLAYANGTHRLEPPLATPARAPRHLQDAAPIISQEQSAHLGCLYRRLHREADQLIGYMEQIGIAGTASRDLRAKLHAIKSEIIAARVRRDLSK